MVHWETRAQGDYVQALTLTDQPVWLVWLVFVGAAAAVWVAGTRVSGYADVISQRTGLGQAIVGLVLLGGITSLPEIAASSTSALAGDAPLAVNNLLGGVAMQVAILAIGDLAVGRAALTSVVV